MTGRSKTFALFWGNEGKTESKAKVHSEKIREGGEGHKQDFANWKNLSEEKTLKLPIGN